MSYSKSIVYIQYTNPSAYPPLEHSSRLLANNEWQVTFLGIEAHGGSNSIHFASHPRIRVKLLPYCPPGFLQKLHYIYFGLWVFWNRLKIRPSVVYVSDAWSYPIGYAIYLLTASPVVMHEHDTPLNQGGFIGNFLAWCRKRLARCAEATICPQSDRARIIQKELNPKRLLVVHNCPLLGEQKEAITNVSEVLRLWFHGSIVPSQLPSCIIEAMAACSFSVQLEIAGYETIGHLGYVDRLLSIAKERGLQGNVVYHGVIPERRDMLMRASQCHLGLSLFSKIFREPMVGASNKPFDYLASGLVIIVPDTIEWKEFFVDRKCAVACDSEDSHSISEALEWCWRNRDQLRTMNSFGREMLESEWNYEAQFEPVRLLLERTITHT